MHCLTGVFKVFRTYSDCKFQTSRPKFLLQMNCFVVVAGLMLEHRLYEARPTLMPHRVNVCFV